MERGMMRTGWMVLAIAAVLCSTAVGGNAYAQQAVPGEPVDGSLFGVWEWRNIGPNRGGRSIAAAGSSSRPLEYYFGATGGGLWKTTDGGNTWFPVSDGYFKSASVGSIGICEANPDVVYAGMGEGQFRGTIETGDGAYGTRDGGSTWTYLGLGSSTGQTAVPRMRVHPQDCDLLYAAVLGDPYGPNPERGIFRSRDGGKSWEKILYRGPEIGASDLMLDPNDPSTMYATLWHIRRPPWGGRTGDGSGIFKSTDGGDSWTELTRNPGLPKVRIGKVGISVSGGDPNRVYAVIEAEVGHGGVYRSDDAGRTWKLMNDNNALFHRAEYYIRIVADPQDPDRVYILNKNFFRSDDGGKTYVQVNTPHGDHHDLWIAPNDPMRMIEADDGGGTVSFNGGKTWTEQDYPTSQMYHVFVTNDYPYLVCGAQQDNSSKCVPSDGGGDFWYQGPGGEQGYIAVHPTRTTFGFGGSQRGGLTAFDRSTGQRRNVDIWPYMSDGESAAMQRERFQWTFPIVMSPHDPSIIYAGSQHVWRTSNGGQSWERISPDLTRAVQEMLMGSQQPIKDHNSQDYYATIFTIAPSPHDPGVLWTGSDDGLIHITRDGGKSWENVTPPDLPEFTKASLIAVSPHTPGKAYLAAERYKLRDVNPYIYKTADYGKSWMKIVNGIPEGHFVRAVKEDPERPGLLYAGTEYAPYISFDDGAHWQSIALNLPAVQVSDLEVKDNDLVISTYGRGFYILDDISPLRELGPRVLERDFHLFRPADAVRTRGGPTGGIDGAFYRRTGLPGANQANIYYHLNVPAGRVVISFRDADGNLIRSFSSADEDWTPIRNSVDHAINSGRWGSATPPPPVETDPGLHGFEWDMRYPPATDFVGLRSRGVNADGPVAPPGTYRVEVTVDGESQTEDFQILKDPRLTRVTQEDLEAQFGLAMRVHRKTDEATSAVVFIRNLKVEIDDRARRAGTDEIGRAAASLKEQLSAIELELYQVGAEAESDLKHLGTKLTNKLMDLSGVIRSADARPTTQSYEVFDILSSRVDAQRARLEELLEDELARLNELLEERGLPRVGESIATAEPF